MKIERGLRRAVEALAVASALISSPTEAKETRHREPVQHRECGEDMGKSSPFVPYVVCPDEKALGRFEAENPHEIVILERPGPNGEKIVEPVWRL